MTAGVGNTSRTGAIWAVPCRPKKRLYVRRITLYRPGDEDLILVTNLCDAAAFPAVDLLEVYLNRWGIERMFQQVVEVFGLSHLMGTTPEGTIFQFALCLLLYNLIQVVRGVVAVETERQRETISAEKLFQDVQREMIAWSVTVAPEETIEYFDRPWTARLVKVRLSKLLGDAWRDRWLKSPPKKNRRLRKTIRRRTHNSVFRILEAHQLRLKKEKRRLALA